MYPMVYILDRLSTLLPRGTNFRIKKQKFDDDKSCEIVRALSVIPCNVISFFFRRFHSRASDFDEFQTNADSLACVTIFQFQSRFYIKIHLNESHYLPLISLLHVLINVPATPTEVSNNYLKHRIKTES